MLKRNGPNIQIVHFEIVTVDFAIKDHNARVDFHILNLLVWGLFRSPEGVQSQYSPARKITTSYGEDCHLQNCGTKFDPRAIVATF